MSPLLLSPRSPNTEGEQILFNPPWKAQRSTPSPVTRGLAAPPPPVDLIDAPVTSPFTETHGIVHSTPPFAPIYEQPVANPSSSRQFQWAHQEQLDVMARSLVNAKAESEDLKRKCVKLQQTISQLRENSTSQSDEEGELPHSTSRNGQKGRSRVTNTEPGVLYALPSGSHDVGVFGSRYSNGN